MNMVKNKKFVIMATQRSGSSWVADMLHDHPRIKMYEELFLSEYKEKPSIIGADDILTWRAFLFQKNGGIQKVLRPYFCYMYLERVYSSESLTSHSIGFKLMYNQLQCTPEILFYMLLNNVHIIHIIRRNFLDVIISKETKAARGGIAHSKTKVDQVQVYLDTTNLIYLLKQQEKKVNRAKCIFSNIRLPYYEVNYEDLVSGKEKFSDILEFLCVKPTDIKLSASLVKLNKGPHCELIKNYEQVKNTLDRTKYAHLL